MWILPDCHGVVALLVISGKQPSSELLHTLRFISVCVGHLSASVQYLRHLLHNTEALLGFQATFSYVSPSRLSSTTKPLATVPGYHTISTILYLKKNLRGGNSGIKERHNLLAWLINPATTNFCPRSPHEPQTRSRPAWLDDLHGTNPSRVGAVLLFLLPCST